MYLFVWLELFHIGETTATCCGESRRHSLRLLSELRAVRLTKARTAGALKLQVGFLPKWAISTSDSGGTYWDIPKWSLHFSNILQIQFADNVQPRITSLVLLKRSSALRRFASFCGRLMTWIDQALPTRRLWVERLSSSPRLHERPKEWAHWWVGCWCCEPCWPICYIFKSYLNHI